MPRKGMRSLFFFSSSPSSSSSPSTPSSHSRRPSPPPQLSFSDSLMDDNFTTAQEIITKWDSDSSPYAKITSLFHENRQESRLFLKSVQELQQAMHFYVSVDSSSPKLVQAQTLMQMAMKRLEKEFYQILAANRDHLDPESISGKSSANTTVSSISDIEDEIGYEDEIQEAGDSIQEVERVSSLAMEDLRAIAECMISSGYGKECLKIYKIIRKSIVDEALYRLGFERMTAQQLQKLDWQVVDNKIRVWLHAVKISVKTLFSGERILCDHVFTASKTVAESCYSEIVKEAATGLFEFPELVTKSKKSPEKTFRFLDMYDAIAEIWPEIEATFSYESTSAVRAQAVNALIKLGESVRLMLADFESAIQKDSSKAAVPGGGNHPLTRYVMNYVSFLSDYTAILADIFADWPLKVKSSLPETFLSDNSSSFSSDNPISSISVRLAWIILVLLCKLDGKAELYKDAGLAYLFLSNNLNYVVGKVKSSNLAAILGDEWVDKHEAKVKLYVGNYERMAWNTAISALPENPIPEISPEEVKEVFRKFNSGFEDTYRRHSGWVVPDTRLRDEIKLSLARKLIPKYREFYQTHRPILGDERGLTAVVRFAPEDLGNHLSDLFYGESVSGSATPSRGPR